MPAASVEAVDVLVPDEAAEGELVKPRERELPGVRVTREHQRDTALPEPVGFLGDVREGQRRQVASHAGHGAVSVGVRRVRVVEADDLHGLMPHVNHGVLVAQDERTRAHERLLDLVGARPVVVVAEHADDGCSDRADDGVELVEELLAVTHEVAGDDDEVGPRGVRDADGLLVDAHRRHPAHVEVRQMGDADGVHRRGIRGGPREPPELDLAEATLIGGRLEQILEREGSHPNNITAPPKSWYVGRVDAELVGRVAGRYKSVSARMYAKGKLGSDPIAAQLVELGAARNLGEVVDVGCGRGQMAVLLLEAGVAARVTGVDWDEGKLAEARIAAEGLPATFEKSDVREVTPPACDTVLLIDVLHYLTDKQQADVLERCARAARRNVVVRELDPDRGWRSATTKVQEAVTTFFGYNVGERVRVLPFAELVGVLERAGLGVRVEPSWGKTPFSNVMVVGERA